jgi:NTE family protein
MEAFKFKIPFFGTRKVGLALGSGGVRGFAHIGVLKVLKKKGVNIDYIAGSSAGAVVGAFYAALNDADHLEQFALETSNVLTGLKITDPVFKGGIIRGDKVEALVRMRLSNVTFDKLKIPLTIVATDLNTGQEVRFSEGDMIKAIRASISVPMFFTPVFHEGRLLADGGLSNPVPDDVVSDMGADIIIAVNLDSGKFNETLDESNYNIKKVSVRSLNVLRYNLSKYCTREADIVIEPDIKDESVLGWNKFFDKKNAQRLIKAGEEAAEAALERIIAMIN